MAEQVAEKIKTSTPEIHLAAGKSMDQLEVITPGAPGAAGSTSGAEANNEQKAHLPAEAKSEPAQQPVAINLDEISDEDFNKMLAKRTDNKIKTIEDLNPPVVKTKEELEKEAEKKRNDARAWALETGAAKSEDYDTAAVIRSKTDRDLALQIFTSSLQSDDKDITAEEAEEIFKDVYHESADEKSRAFVIGQKNIKSLADSYRKEHLDKLENINSLYDEEIQNRDQFVAYKGQLKKISAELPKEFKIDMPYKYLDGAEETISYTIPVDEAVMAKLIKDHSSDKAFVLRSISTSGKINEKDLSADMTKELKAAMFDKALPELLKLNTKEVEKRMEVVLGNKRNPLQTLNNGQQNLPPKPQQKNDYSALSKADSLMR